MHRSNWPQPGDLSSFANNQDPSLLSLASRALMGIRKAKSDEKLSMKAEIESLTIEASEQELEQLRQIESDLKSVGKIESVDYKSGDTLSISQVAFKPAQ